MSLNFTNFYLVNLICSRFFIWFPFFISSYYLFVSSFSSTPYSSFVFFGIWIESGFKMITNIFWIYNNNFKLGLSQTDFDTLKSVPMLYEFRKVINSEFYYLLVGVGLVTQYPYFNRWVFIILASKYFYLMQYFRLVTHTLTVIFAGDIRELSESQREMLTLSLYY
jgi:hypothetical protein